MERDTQADRQTERNKATKLYNSAYYRERERETEREREEGEREGEGVGEREGEDREKF